MPDLGLGIGVQMIPCVLDAQGFVDPTSIKNLAAWWRPDQNVNTDGAAAFVAASSQYLSAADQAALEATGGSITVGVFVYPTSLPASAQVITKQNDGGGANLAEYYIGTASGTPHWAVSNDRTASNVTAVNGSSTISANAWHFLVGQIDAVNNQIHIQVDNGTVVSTSYTLANVSGASDFRIGAINSTPTSFFNGRVAMAFKVNRLLTSAELTSIYNSGTGLYWDQLSATIQGYFASNNGEWWDLNITPAGGNLTGRANTIVLTNNNSVGPAAGPGSAPAVVGDPVYQVLDASGNSVTMSQATPTAQPSLNSHTYNSKALKELLYDGAATFLSAGNVSALNFEYTNPFTLWGIIRPTSFSAAQAWISKRKSTGNAPGWIGVLGTDAKVYLALIGASGGVAQAKAGTVLTAGNPYAIVCTNDGSGVAAGLQVWINAIKQTMTTTSDNLAGQSIVQTAGVDLAAEDGLAEFFTGGISHAGIYTAKLADSDCVNLSNWMLAQDGGP